MRVRGCAVYVRVGAERLLHHLQRHARLCLHARHERVLRWCREEGINFGTKLGTDCW